MTYNNDIVLCILESVSSVPGGKPPLYNNSHTGNINNVRVSWK